MGFRGVEILWKGTVSSEFRAIRPKLCGNCAFPQNFHTAELGEITVFYAVRLLKLVSSNVYCRKLQSLTIKSLISNVLYTTAVSFITS